MSRSEFQPGPATDHYHDTLGVAETNTGIQTIRLLEATVNFDDANLQTTGVPLGWAFIEGVWVIDAWVQVFTPFQNGGSTYVNAYITTDSASPGAIPYTGWDISGGAEDVDTDFEFDNDTSGGATFKRRASETDAALHRGVPARVRVSCNALFVAAPDAGGAFTVGELRVFALIASAA